MGPDPAEARPSVHPRFDLERDVTTRLDSARRNTRMKTRLFLLVIAVVAATSVGLHSQQQPSAPASALPSPPVREPGWAFPVQAGSLPPESPEPKSVEGSTKKYTPKEIDDLLNPPDWLPEAHKPAPSIVVKGHGAALACGSCHLMSGLGHPESADLTGYHGRHTSSSRCRTSRPACGRTTRA